MTYTANLIFVDAEARGTSPVNGIMTEFGAVHYNSRRTFHGVLYEGRPDPDNPAIPLVGNQVATPEQVAEAFGSWLDNLVHANPVFVSDNVAYDWMWIAGLFDEAGMPNRFGHSGRRISDFYAGLTGDWSNTQEWKKWRRTKHDHNPVHDALGNVEAFVKILALTSGT